MMGKINYNINGDNNDEKNEDKITYICKRL